MDTTIEKGHFPEQVGTSRVRVLIAESRFTTKVMEDVFKLLPDVSVTVLQPNQTVIGELERAREENIPFDIAFIARTLGSQNGEEIAEAIQSEPDNGNKLVNSVFLTTSANNTREYSPEEKKKMGLGGVVETDGKGLGKIPRLITAYKNSHSQQQK